MAEDNAVKLVDLDNMDASMVEENISINGDSNPMADPPPPSDGVHRVKLVGAKEWEVKETKANKEGNKTTFYKTQFSCVIVDEGADKNKRLFGRVNTLVFDGKSEIAYILLQVLGGNRKLPNGQDSNPQAKALVESLKNINDLAKAFRDALAKEPIIKVKSRWEASYKITEDGKADVYKIAKAGQNQFPKFADGSYNPVFVHPTAGELKAQAVIQDYFPDVAV